MKTIQSKKFDTRTILIVLIIAIIGVVLLQLVRAAGPKIAIQPRAEHVSGGGTLEINDSTAYERDFVQFGQVGNNNELAYQRNLDTIQAQPWRNKSRDNTPYRDWPMSRLDADAANQLNNDREAYHNGLRGDPYFTEVYNFFTSRTHLEGGGGLRHENESQFRIGCEFSHFAYDDPIVYPNEPERAHLHMFFGNTDVNAYTNYQKLLNEGGGTCNGNEMNRTGYWAPAVFDQDGYVRIPDFLNIYYKNEASGRNVFAMPFPVAAEDTWVKSSYPGERIPGYEGMQLLANINELDTGNFPRRFVCIDKRGNEQAISISNIPDLAPCAAGHHFEVAVFFPPCWNRQLPLTNYKSDNLGYPWDGIPGNGKLFYDRWLCDDAGYMQETFSGIVYRMRYNVEPGDNTQLWYLSSDVDRGSLTRNVPGGTETHGDWWEAWSPTVKELWHENCQNTVGASCGYGFMDARTIEQSPNGPTLRFREKYQPAPGYSVNKIPAQDIFNALCSHRRTLQRPEQAAHCTPG
jgi:hypothetical protein